ncbi:uncharacterized protein H6S33_012770 [Morchella sextelata]|uniref:uncharacterized protein n=1 Tax=Morchella sextelata TaxID=1174677 RepID=UPI001D0578B9|nr:uncharacterized protein H6S33_012770 [Morchella sextelata]KAH0609284.1 hypothetical protein H6S33_012770 [Morchella sextelata]
MDPSKTQTPLYQDPQPSSTIDPSKTQTPLYQDPHTQPPSYDSSFPIPVSSASSAPYSPAAVDSSLPIPVSTATSAPYSPAAIDPSANIYDIGHEPPIPVRTPSQYAPECVPEFVPEFVPEQRPRINSHGSSKYLHAVPLHSLTRRSAPVDCPVCNRRGATKCTSKSGNFTHVWAAVTCSFSCLGCIPYMISGLKDVKHSCASCGTTLAVWHRSGGGTDVLAHALK